MFERGNFIGGEWREGGEPMPVFNPARPSQQVGQYSAATQAQLDECMERAVRAQKEWRARPEGERVAALQAFARKVEQNIEVLARAITAEQGKPLAESRGEVLKSCAEARFMAQHAMLGTQSAASLRPGVRNMVVRRPRGIIAAICPWNFPVMTPMRKIAPAVAFGNAIVLKPSEFTPAAACMLVEMSSRTFPDGLIQLVHGTGAIGAALVSHPAVQGVTFTGSVETGRRIVQATAANLAECALELGGKNAALIHDPVHIGNAVNAIVQAAYMCSGQRCTAISRVLVHRSRYDETLELLCRQVRELKIGEGCAEGVQFGPMTHAAQFERVHGMARRAVQQGAALVTGGKVAEVPGCEGGYFYEPTVLAGVDPSSEIAQEEVFGPVLAVTPYDGFESGMEMLNGVRYGLTASLFAHDAAVVERFLTGCETGMLHVNQGTVPDSHMPFGGIKSSGLGAYSVGPSAAAFYTTEHSVYMQV